MLTIDELAYTSRLLKTAPKAKMLFGAVPLVLCLFFSSLAVSAATILSMSFITVWFGGVPARKYMSLLMVPLGFLAIGAFTIVFTRCGGERALLGVYVFGEVYGVTAKSLLFGANITLKALGAVSCMYFISLSTPMTDILDALRSMKVPALLVSLMELTYRYIFVFLDEARRIRTAQDSRLGYAGFKTGVSSLGQLAGTLFLRVYTRTDRIYDALRSRGYDGAFRTVKREYPPAKRMYTCCALLSAVLIAVGVAGRMFL